MYSCMVCVCVCDSACPPADLDISTFGYVFSKRDVALYICYMDVFSVLVYLCVTYWIRFKEEDAVKSRKSVTAGTRAPLAIPAPVAFLTAVRLCGCACAANYTVMVTNLPRGLTQYELEAGLR